MQRRDALPTSSRGFSRPGKRIPSLLSPPVSEGIYGCADGWNNPQRLFAQQSLRSGPSVALFLCVVHLCPRISIYPSGLHHLVGDECDFFLHFSSTRTPRYLSFSSEIFFLLASVIRHRFYCLLSYVQACCTYLHIGISRKIDYAPKKITSSGHVLPLQLYYSQISPYFNYRPICDS